MKSMLLAEKKHESVLKRMLDGMTELFSNVLEEELNNKQALLILNAALAIFVTLMSGCMPMWCTGVGLIWMVHALTLCKKAGLGEE